MARPAPPSLATSLSSTAASPSSSPTLPDRRASADSTENVCLGMDEDLENKLEAGRSEKQLENGEEGQPPPVPHHHPATLEPDDAENPRNWPVRKKVVFDVVMCTQVLSLTYASTAFVTSIPSVMEELQISQEVAILGVSLCVIGFAGGPLVMGPSSELFGRRPVYLVCGILYTVFSWIASEANNAPLLLISRFLIGFFGASGINNVPASVGDITTPLNRTRYTVPYAFMAFGGPALGPLCSSFIQVHAGFRVNFRVMAAFNTIMSILVGLQPETHGPTLLKNRIARAGNAPPPLSIARFLGIYRIALARPIVFICTEPVVTLICIYLSFLYGVLYSCFQSFQIVYKTIRGFDETSYGLTFISLGMGFIVAATLLATVGDRIYHRAAVHGQPTAPEHRLGLAYAAAITTPLSLFIFAWTAPFVQVHWIVPVITQGIFAGSIFCIFTAFVPYLVDVYGPFAASALAAGMASRALFGGIFPLFSFQMYEALTVQGATSLFAGFSCLLAPIPFIFRRYGHQIRGRSKFARA